MTGTINDLMDENARLKTKVEELEAALKERLRFMTEHFEQNGKELGRASGEIDILEARWSALRVWLVDQHNLSPDDREVSNPNAVQAKMAELEKC
jgi:predicted nuclease with TOPRIM domain